MLQPCRLPNGFPATATFLVMAAFVPALASAGSVGFTNGGFEDGDLTGWTVQHWLNDTGIPSLIATPARSPVTFGDLNLTADTNSGSSTATSPTSQTYTGIVPTGSITSPDPLSLSGLTFPLYGSYSAVVNQLDAGVNAEKRATSLSQTAVMSSSNIDAIDGKLHVRFAFAGVVELPTHTANQQPYIFVEVQDLTKGITLYSRFVYAGQTGAGWIAGPTTGAGSSGPWFYTQWQTVDVAPGAGTLDVGDSVEIIVVASACEPGKHESYVYVDGGLTDTSFPSPTVSASGPASVEPSQVITYTYTYVNPMNSPVADVQVVATLPPDTTYVSTTGTGCTTPSPGGTGTVTCPIGTVAADSEASFTITVTIASEPTFPINNGVYQISGTGIPTLSGPLLSTPETPQYNITGPSTGVVNTAATFTITPTSAITSTITITPSGGGLSTAVVKTFSNSSTSQTFTITPTATGIVELNPVSASSTLLDPPVTVYHVSAGTYTLTGPTNGTVGIASSVFTITPGQAISGTITITPSGGGLSAPITLTFSNSSMAQTFTITPTATGTVTLVPSNNASLQDASSLTYTSIPAATGYTLTGPAGGAVGSTSTNFTVTPNAAYTGTITITPSGGGLSTAIVLTFSNSPAAQTFTITPTAVGPVTLTPTNSGSLANASALSYATNPAAPTIGAAGAGNGSASVAFTAPVNTGGSTITGYTATCSPGSITGTGTTSPITVSPLTNGTPYMCTVTATNTYGPSAASGASNSVTPAALATGYTLTGPAGGAVGSTSTNFTVTPNAAYSGTITITPAGGGLSTAIVLTFSNSPAAQTFTITPTAVGPVTLTPTNSGSLANASALSYATNPAAPTIGAAGAGNGSASVAFTAPVNTGGSTIIGYTATCSPGSITGTGTTSPITVSPLTNGTPYMCTVTARNTYGPSAASGASNSVTPAALATGYTLTGPAGGAVGSASTNFTVTPNAAYSGTITITPAGGGLSTAIVLTFSNSPAAQTFTITPTAVGPVTLTPTNSGSLANASALSYATNPAAPTIGAAGAGNGSASVAFTAPVNTGGSTIIGYTATCSPGSITGTGTTSPITVSPLPTAHPICAR